MNMNKIAATPMCVRLRRRAKELRIVNALIMVSVLLMTNHCQCDWTRAIHGTIKSPRRAMLSPLNMAKKRVRSIALRPQKHSSVTVNHQKKE
jgi:hypothetical protein